MKLADLALLQTKFNEEKQFIDGGYYRLRQLDEHHYELAYLVADSCGSTSVHPQITIALEAGVIKPMSLLDFAATPTRQLRRTPETEAELEQALAQLVSQFLTAAQ